MAASNKIPFPQADDMNKILKIINIDVEEKLLDKKVLCVILGDITERQVQYYINAAQYLDIIDFNKKFTAFGQELRKSNQYDLIIKLSQKIISKEIFGIAFFSELVLGTKLTKEDVIGLMRKENLFGAQSIYDRRSQTVIKWLYWIKSNTNLNDLIK